MRCAARCALLALVAGVAVIACAADEGAARAQAQARGARRPARSSSAARWFHILSQYARDAYGDNVGGAGAGAGGWARPFPVDLPIGEAGADGLPATLPLLVLPLPVPVPVPAPAPSSSPECSARDRHEPASPPRPAPAPFAPAPFAPPPRPRPRPSLDYGPLLDERFGDIDRPAGANVSSARLVELFRAQAPDAPDLPPVVRLDARSGADADGYANGYADAPADADTDGYAEARRYLPPTPAPAPEPRGADRAPPHPRFERSLMLRAELTVPRADYTEPYTVWWDAESGASRVDMHYGETVLYRSPRADGTMRQLEVSAGREADGARRGVHCGEASGARSEAEELAPPALPDTRLFSFAGYLAEGAERWTRTVSGGAGEGGAARGESLTFHHELTVRRAADGFATPLKYSVRVDSSVLGADCDGYEHRYLEARPQQHAPDAFHFDMGACTSREQLDARDPEHAARLAPLREFTLPQRDTRHLVALDRFTSEFGRQYADGAETALRTTLLAHHARFVASGNRQSNTFELEINFLGDRLDAELDVLLGTLFDNDPEDGLSFPYSEARVRALKERLPEEFDWRPRGAVSPVRYQGSCSSCWAFAVTGSVEGALFVRTRRLVELAEQCLVDCAHSHGAHGCKGTWPSHAYDYVRDRGLPARAEYTPYKEKVLPCRAPPVPPVTHISGYVDVTPHNIDALKVAIRRSAPTVVVVDAKAKSFMFYKKGVLRDERCVKGPKPKLNHAVLAVGWGVQSGEPHFIIKNTYSAAWGDGGYVRLHAPSNACGVLTVPSYARLQRADVDRADLLSGTGVGARSGDGDGAGDEDDAGDDDLEL